MYQNIIAYWRPRAVMAAGREAVYARHGNHVTGGRRPASRRACAPRMQTRAPNASQDLSRIERLCVERGLKMTGQRRLIARVLSEALHGDIAQGQREKTLRRFRALTPELL